MPFDLLVWTGLTYQAAMSQEQRAAFAAFGPGWLSPGTSALFFASVFAVLMLYLVVSVMLDCYAAWQEGHLSIQEGGRLILEVTFFLTLLLMLLR